MQTEGNDTPQNTPRFIQDIAGAHARHSRRIPVREEEATIGELDAAWRAKDAGSLYHRLHSTPRTQSAAKSSMPNFHPQLRVAPLSLLDTRLVGDTGHWARRNFALAISPLLALPAVISDFYTTKFRPWITHLMPTTYTLTQGLKIDWYAGYLRGLHHYGRPLIAAAAMLLLIIFNLPDGQAPSPDTGKKPHQPATSNSGSDSQSSAYHHSGNTTSGNVSSSITDTGTGDSSGSSSPSVAGTNTPTSTQPVLEYGRGGDTQSPSSSVPSSPTSPAPPQSSSPSPTTSLPQGIPGVTTPLPVTVPGESIDLQDKPALSTSPTTVTLN